MTSLYQLVGLIAVAVGLAGTWMAARRRSGWLLCIASTIMWLPALVTGEQWAALVNCGLSVVICVRNFHAQGDRLPGSESAAPETSGVAIPAQRSAVSAGAAGPGR